MKETKTILAILSYCFEQVVHGAFNHNKRQSRLLRLPLLKPDNSMLLVGISSQNIANPIPSSSFAD